MNFYITRYVTSMLYTFELLFATAVLISCIIIARRKKDKIPLWIFLATTLFHTCIELWAEGFGIRVVEDTVLFNLIPIVYPITPIILGLFEGGLVGLSGLLLTRILLYKDKFALKFLSSIIGALLFFEIMGIFTIKKVLFENPAALEITRREVFGIGSIIILIIMYTVAIIGILPWKKVSKTGKIGLLYYYLGLVLITTAMDIPLHISGLRYAEIFNGTTYVRVNILLDILILYVFDIGVEAAGFFIAYYVIYHHVGWIEKKN
ncbi:MAG: hypothetical protein ACTSX4_06300 [Candidatus Helarchaeota archaeon]